MSQPVFISLALHGSSPLVYELQIEQEEQKIGGNTCSFPRRASYLLLLLFLSLFVKNLSQENIKNTI